MDSLTGRETARGKPASRSCMIMDGGYLGEVSRVIGGAGGLKARGTHSLTRKHILEENRHRSHASAVTGALGPLVTASALLAFGLIPASRTSAQSVSPPPVTILQDSGSLADGFIFLGAPDIREPNTYQGAEIIDNQGRIVWFLPTP